MKIREGMKIMRAGTIVKGRTHSQTVLKRHTHTQKGRKKDSMLVL